MNVAYELVRMIQKNHRTNQKCSIDDECGERQCVTMETQRYSRANVMLECMALPTATGAIVVCCYMYLGVVPNEAEELQQQPRYTSGTSRCDG